MIYSASLNARYFLFICLDASFVTLLLHFKLNQRFSFNTETYTSSLFIPSEDLYKELLEELVEAIAEELYHIFLAQYYPHIAIQSAYLDPDEYLTDEGEQLSKSFAETYSSIFFSHI